MTDSENILFKTLAAKYLWWLMPDEALKRPERIAIQVMNLGDFADVTAILDAVGEDQAREFRVTLSLSFERSGVMSDITPERSEVHFLRRSWEQEV